MRRSRACLAVHMFIHIHGSRCIGALLRLLSVVSLPSTSIAVNHRACYFAVAFLIFLFFRSDFYERYIALDHGTLVKHGPMWPRQDRHGKVGNERGMEAAALVQASHAAKLKQASLLPSSTMARVEALVSSTDPLIAGSTTASAGLYGGVSSAGAAAAQCLADALWARLYLPQAPKLQAATLSMPLVSPSAPLELAVYHMFAPAQPSTGSAVDDGSAGAAGLSGGDGGGSSSSNTSDSAIGSPSVPFRFVDRSLTGGNAGGGHAHHGDKQRRSGGDATAASGALAPVPTTLAPLQPSGYLIRGPSAVCVGRTHVFMSKHYAECIESARSRAAVGMEAASRRIQTRVRTWLARRLFLRFRWAIIRTQARFRMLRHVRAFAFYRRQAMIVKAMVVGNHHRLLHVRKVRTVAAVKRLWRRMRMRVQARRLKAGLHAIQNLARGYITRTAVYKWHCAAIRLQIPIRRFLQRQRQQKARSRVAAAIQAQWRGRCSRRKHWMERTKVLALQQAHTRQRFVRRSIAVMRGRAIRDQYRLLRSSVVRLQRWLRGAMIRRAWRRVVAAVLTMQAGFRGMIARRQVGSLKAIRAAESEARSLQALRLSEARCLGVIDSLVMQVSAAPASSSSASAALSTEGQHQYQYQYHPSLSQAQHLNLAAAVTSSLRRDQSGAASAPGRQPGASNGNAAFSATMAGSPSAAQPQHSAAAVGLSTRLIDVDITGPAATEVYYRTSAATSSATAAMMASIKAANAKQNHQHSQRRDVDDDDNANFDDDESASLQPEPLDRYDDDDGDDLDGSASQVFVTARGHAATSSSRGSRLDRRSAIDDEAASDDSDDDGDCPSRSQRALIRSLATWRTMPRTPHGRRVPATCWSWSFRQLAAALSNKEQSQYLRNKANGGSGPGRDSQSNGSTSASSSLQVTSLAVGESHTLALASDGVVYSWGWSDYGQAGQGTSGPVAGQPRPIVAFTDPTHPAHPHASAIGNTRSASMVASARSGSTLRGTVVPPSMPGMHRPLLGSPSSSPALLAPIVITAIAAGRDHSVALSSNGLVYAWGCNTRGQCGLGHRDSVAFPVHVSGLNRKVASIACGDRHTVMLTATGAVFSCGAGEAAGHGEGNENGGNQTLVDAATLRARLTKKQPPSPQRGQRTAPPASSSSSTAVLDVLSPQPVRHLAYASIVSIATGTQHTVAVAATGEAWAWGSNDCGQCAVTAAITATGGVAVVLVPTQIIVTAASASASTAGHNAAALVPTSPSAGNAADAAPASPHKPSATANATTATSASPPQPPPLIPSSASPGAASAASNSSSTGAGVATAPTLRPYRFTRAACGSRHSLLLTAGGRVVAFGRNQHGQLGCGDRTDRQAPALVSFQPDRDLAASLEPNATDNSNTNKVLVTVIDIAAAGDSSYALTTVNPNGSNTQQQQQQQLSSRSNQSSTSTSASTIASESARRRLYQWGRAGVVTETKTRIAMQVQQQAQAQSSSGGGASSNVSMSQPWRGSQPIGTDAVEMLTPTLIRSMAGGSTTSSSSSSSAAAGGGAGAGPTLVTTPLSVLASGHCAVSVAWVQAQTVPMLAPTIRRTGLAGFSGQASVPGSGGRDHPDSPSGVPSSLARTRRSSIASLASVEHGAAAALASIAPQVTRQPSSGRRASLGATASSPVGPGAGAGTLQSPHHQQRVSSMKAGSSPEQHHQHQQGCSSTSSASRGTTAGTVAAMAASAGRAAFGARPARAGGAAVVVHRR